MTHIGRTIPRFALAACAAFSAMLGACVGPTPAPLPTPAARQLAPPPPPPVVPTDWHDMPATSGAWQWRREGRLSIARFVDSAQSTLLSLSCDPSAGTIRVTRNDLRGTATTMAILTTSVSRKLAIQPGGGMITAALFARDPLLDAMAYSRGRFAVEVPGMASLYLPAWPEVGRVIEDCRG